MRLLTGQICQKDPRKIRILRSMYMQICRFCGAGGRKKLRVLHDVLIRFGLRATLWVPCVTLRVPKERIPWCIHEAS